MHDLEVMQKRYKRLCLFRKVLSIVAAVFALVALVVSIFNPFDWNESTKQSVLQLFVSTRRAPLIFVIPIVLVELRWRKLKKELQFLEECQFQSQSHTD